MHLIDEAQRELAVGLVVRSTLELQEVADGEGVRPQVSLRLSFSNQARALGKRHHEIVDKGGCFLLVHCHWDSKDLTQRARRFNITACLKARLR
jgi:hypothetical protein